MGAQHGPGKMTFPDGSCYEGTFNTGKRTSAGKLTTATGDVYEGEFHENQQRHGQGKLVTA